MRLLNIVLVILVLIIVVSLGRMYLADQGKLSFSSNIPSLQITLKNQEYLEKKLEAYGFWKENKIFIHNTVKPTFYTAKKLHVVLVDADQTFGKTELQNNPGIAASSYGISIDRATGIATLSLFLNSAVQTDSLRDMQYSALLLTSIYDLTHVAQDESELDALNKSRVDVLLNFIKEAKADPNKSVFLKVVKK
jgi:hypothetical protein